MGNTIAKPVHHTVVLGGGGYGNTVLLTSTGTIVPGISATALIAPDTLGSAFITNDGLVKGGSGGRNAAAGGIGIEFASATGSIKNAGLIVGGHGGYTAGQYGGAGGIGLLGTGAPNVGNSGTIVGGAGGLALGSFASSGAGGVGVSLSDGAITNIGLIKGGHGGGTYYGFAGGYGGNGASVSTGASLQNMASIQGGAGGVGSYLGGSGGTGLMLGSGAGAVSNSGRIAGGNGGAEGQDGSGGIGGVGVVLGSGDAITSSGTILGGRGGYGYSGGYGGDGVDINGGTLVSSGLIMAGAYAGGSAYGGVGVNLNGGTLVTSGVVAGAAGSNHVSDSVAFGSQAGKIVIEVGAIFKGAISGFGAGDVLDTTTKVTSLTFISGTLTLEHNNKAFETLSLTGTFTAANFHLAADGHGGTDITYGTAGQALPDFATGMLNAGDGENAASREHASPPAWHFGDHEAGHPPIAVLASHPHGTS